MAATAARAGTPPLSGSFRWAGYLLGFALGGFFDGILLHQVLQWHHLLSGLEGARFQDLRVQILADGLFHVVMYVVMAVGLWLLWRSRADFPRPGADRLLVANALIGFGGWHVIDGILSHWVLQIHRIRMDSEAPLIWDLAWFAAFGIAFIAAGLAIRRGPAAGTGRGVPAALVLLVLASGAAAAIPPADPSSPVVVVFMPGITAQQALAAVASVDGLPVWTDRSGQVWAVALPEDARPVRLYREGALLVGRSFLPIGCLGWMSG